MRSVSFHRAALLSLAVLLLAAGTAARAQTVPYSGEPADPVPRARVAAFNVALTGSLALARGWIEGHVQGGGDALRIFASGAAGGYGFYQAKRLGGHGHALPGLALAYASASVVENAAGGRHPLSHVRFGPGPVDVRLRTPFARPHQPLVTVQVNVFSTAGAVVLPLLGYRPAFHAGTLHFASDEPLGQRGRYRTVARTLNRTTLVGPDPLENTWEHELVHVMQSLQIGATTPYYTLSSLRPPASYALGGSRVAWDLQFDWLYGLLALPTALVDYDERWNEVEAYTLAPVRERRDRPEEPPREGCPPGIYCLD